MSPACAAALAVALLPAAARAAEGRPALERHLPEWLLRYGPGDLAWWQWLAIPALVFVALAAGALLGWATRRVGARLVARTAATWDDALFARTAGPLTSLWAIGVATLLLPVVALPAMAAGRIDHLLRAFTYLALFWAGYRAVDVLFEAASEAPRVRASPTLGGLLPVGRKIGKAMLLALGLVAVLNELGFKVASLLAGVGIGGIAVALAAQKTLEHLLGSVAIGVDQLFRPGDVVKVEDFTGTVEQIGLRSTRFRTADRTIITIPNGRLADMRTETFAFRDRLRLYANLGLVYGTTAAQLRAVLRGVEAALRAHPKLFPEGVSVRLTELKDSALNVEVAAWFQTSDWGEFTEIRQELLLQFMTVVEEAGTSLAFPTRTVHVVGAPTPEKERARS